MVLEGHVIQSAAKNLPSSELDVERKPFADEFVRGPIDCMETSSG